MHPLKPKPLFASSTIWGATISGIAALFAGVMQPAHRLAVSNYCVPQGAKESAQFTQCTNNVSDWLEIASVVVTTLGLSGAGTAMYGRVNMGDLWTPKGMPGPNQGDIEPNSLTLLPSASSMAQPVRETIESNNFSGVANNHLSADTNHVSRAYAVFNNPEDGI